jgi:hypothetical protein
MHTAWSAEVFAQAVKRDAAGQKLAERGRLCRAEYLPNVPGGWDRRLLFAPAPPTMLGGGR